jgi:hypothetical protein
MPSMIQRMPIQASAQRRGFKPTHPSPSRDFASPGLRTSGPSITVTRAMLFAADIMSALTYDAPTGVWFVVPCRPKSHLAQRPNHTASVI